MPANGFRGRDTGSREFTPDQRREVLQTLSEMSDGGKFVRAEDLTDLTGVGGRTIRAIVNAASGRDLVILTTDLGYKIAETYEEVNRSARRHFSQAARMRERAERELEFARRHLPRNQAILC